MGMGRACLCWGCYVGRDPEERSSRGLVWYCFVYPRTQMYLVKKKWGALHGLPPEAVLLEDAIGTSLSDGSIPEEMGWTIASRNLAWPE